ncbi:MAG: DUF3108 domain-containing protein [Pseudohongiella sp.]|nr:DUF3108 domain-containing protein [Pseudohongiella sp.]
MSRLASFFSALSASALLAFVATSSHAQQALEYSAHYKASANGIAASADRSLIRLEDNSYRLTNILQAKLLGLTVATLEQRSEFDLADGMIKSHTYAYHLSGISKVSNTIAFDWDTQIALSTEDEQSWQLELFDGVMDPLSYQFALRQRLLSATAEEVSAMELDLEFQLIDADEIEHHQYRLLGDEVLLTPLGELNTVKLERVREASDARETTIWLARDWNFLLARIEQVNRSGLRIKLELTSAAIDDELVSALN